MADRDAPDQRANWERIDSILDVVLALPESEREAALEQECDGDQQLIDQVRRLVAADRDAGSFLEDVVRDGARSALEESAVPTALEGALANARTTPLPGGMPGRGDLGGAVGGEGTGEGVGDAGLPETMTLPAGGHAASDEAASTVSSAPVSGVADSIPSRIGKYRVTETIGRGGFGTVYRATDPKLDRDVAIKVCHSNDAPTRQRFLKEARIAARLQHPSIVTVHDFGAFDTAGELCNEDDPSAVPFLVQEFIHGQDLHELLGDERPLQSKVSLLRQIAQGLWFAHRQGVVHRDVKPSNVRVQQTAGRPDSARILDFGIAGLVDEDDPIEAGTLGYLAPEVLDQMLELQPALEAGAEATATRATVARATSGVAAAADQFAFGVLAFELLAGEHPFPGRSLPDVLTQMSRPAAELETALAGVPQPLAELVLRCLARQPERRYAGMGGVVEGLEFAESLERPAAPASSSRRRWLRSGWAAAAVLLMVVGAVFAWTASRERGLRGDEPQVGGPETTGPETTGSETAGPETTGAAAPDRVGPASEGVAFGDSDPVSRQSGNATEAEPGGEVGASTARRTGGGLQENDSDQPRNQRPSQGEPSSQPRAEAARTLRPEPGLESETERAEERRDSSVPSATSREATEPGSGVSREPGSPPSVADPTAEPVAPPGETRLRTARADASGSALLQGDSDRPSDEVRSRDLVDRASMEASESAEPNPAGELELEVLQEVTPNYPPRALRRRLAATVVVAVLVDPEGQVVQTLVKSTDRPGMGFERAAEEAARRTRYRERSGEGAAPTWTEIAFEFRPPRP